MGGSHSARQVPRSARAGLGMGVSEAKPCPGAAAGREMLGQALPSTAPLVPSPVSGTLLQSRRPRSDVPPLSPCLPVPVPSPSGRPGRLALPVPAWCRRDARSIVRFKDHQEGFCLE